MPEPRADFACLSPKCRTEEGASVYELPVAATHCPMGHKRLQRIWTPPHISRGIAEHVDALVEGSGFVEQRHAQRDGRMRHETNTRKQLGMMGNAEKAGLKVVPAGRMGAGMAEATGMPAFGGYSAGPGKAGKVNGVVLGQPMTPQGFQHPVSTLTTGKSPRPDGPKWTPPKGA